MPASICAERRKLFKTAAAGSRQRPSPSARGRTAPPPIHARKGSTGQSAWPAGRGHEAHILEAGRASTNPLRALPKAAMPPRPRRPPPPCPAGPGAAPNTVHPRSEAAPARESPSPPRAAAAFQRPALDFTVATPRRAQATRRSVTARLAAQAAPASGARTFHLPSDTHPLCI